MRLRLLLALALFALPMASLHAAAQGSPTVTISIVDLAPTATVNAGGAHSVGFTVQVEASGFQCTQGGTMQIDVALSNAGAAPPGVTPSVEPANISIAVPGPAVYGAPVPGLPVGAPLNESGAATLRIATTAAASGVFPATVSASFAGGEIAGCVGALPQASATANHQLTINAATSGNTTGGGTTPGPGTGTGGNNTTGQQPAPPPSRGLPGFEPLLVLGAGAIALVARRRRED